MATQARFSAENRTRTWPLPNTCQAINSNGFQLCHMIGNVREWVTDTWQDRLDATIANGSARYRFGTENRRWWLVRGPG